MINVFLEKFARWVNNSGLGKFTIALLIIAPPLIHSVLTLVLRGGHFTDLDAAHLVLIGFNIFVAALFIRLLKNIYYIQLSKAKSDFISIATHQMRTPLSSIKWVIELLLEDKTLISNQRQRLEAIAASTERMIQLINDLLNVTKIEAEEIIKPRPFDIISLITSIVENLKKEAAKKDQRILVNSNQNYWAIEIDPDFISIAVVNILDNAINYGKDNSEITVNINAFPDAVEIQIHNLGFIVEPSEAEKIFSRFYRSEIAKETKPSGSGLGLYIAKTAIERHKGSIWFEPDKDGAGVTFFLKLPTKQK